VFFRPVLPTDEAALRELFYSHSEETIRRRYFTPLKRLSNEQVQQFVTLDYSNNMAIVGFVPFEGREKMIAVARYFRDPAGNEAEVAVTIHDDYQHKGIGTFVLKHLAKIAVDHGITRFNADVLAENTGMMRLFHKISRKVEVDRTNSIHQVRVELRRMPA
jgi:RimJ/RimL family protein N-acetyltransferase